MAPVVRVVGRVDLAEQVCSALRSAGAEVRLSTASALSALTEAAPAGEAELVIATSPWDLVAWRLGKRKHPRRPMVAVAERRREPALRGAVGGAVGPDAFALWPAAGSDLTAAVARAASEVGRPRRWNGADLGRALVYGGICASGVRGGVGYLAMAIGLCLGARHAWNRAWYAVGALAATAVGGFLLFAWLARPR